jgi:signal transduction histidine kinase
MKPADQKPSRSLRGKTDKSLRKERLKTDKNLNQKRFKIERATTRNIRDSRVAADRIRKVKRAREDAAKSEFRRANPRQVTARIDDQNLQRERSSADAALLEERNAIDSLREKERFQKRLISEALLEIERNETDSHISAERLGLDLDSRESEVSHDKTKFELITRDHYMAVVSHDLRSPLSAVSLSSGLLRRALASGKSNPAQLLRFLDTIERNVAHMDRMISDLLDVERMSHGKLTLELQKVDICSLLRECKELFDPVVASKQFTMTVETRDQPFYALVDQDRILQVLSNLIGNALKFTPKGGVIRLFTKEDSGNIEVCVADKGPGIPKDKIHKIFERFSQLGSMDRRGLGLGLFISRWIIEAHGGRISVASKKGKGSTFSFTLPLTAASELISTNS